MCFNRYISVLFEKIILSQNAESGSMNSKKRNCNFLLHLLISLQDNTD